MNRAEQDSVRPDELDRRIFLTGLAAGALPLFYSNLHGRAGAEEPRSKANSGSFAGVITRQKNPDNLEFPFQTLNDFLTPNEQFYVRSHFEVPEIEARTWRLKIEGSVQHPLEITYDELRQMPSRTVTAILECSGNSRVFLKPPQIGIRWEQGAVSNAEWTGVPLTEVLKRAGLKEEATEVILEGTDKGKFEPPDQKSPGIISYARSLPLKRALRPEVLLVYRMNGKDLPASHGYPVRVVVPGWYGMASVKWLKRIIVTDRPFHGFFQTFMYTTWDRRDGLPDLVPVSEIQVKAEIARPALHEVVPADGKVRVHGAAWTGDADIAKVEVSTDGGANWTRARLLDKPVRYAWQFWEFEWQTPTKTGRHTVMARATDNRGNAQPMERDEDRRDAVINHVQPITVEIQ